MLLFIRKTHKIETFSGEHSSPLRCGTMIFANEKLAIRDDTATGEDMASPLQGAYHEQADKLKFADIGMDYGDFRGRNGEQRQ